MAIIGCNYQLCSKGIEIGKFYPNASTLCKKATTHTVYKAQKRSYFYFTQKHDFIRQNTNQGNE